MTGRTLPTFNEFSPPNTALPSAAHPSLTIPFVPQVLPPAGMTQTQADSLPMPDTLPDYVLEIFASALASALSHDTLCIFNDTA
jgi:hypothetical protein